MSRDLFVNVFIASIGVGAAALAGCGDANGAATEPIRSSEAPLEPADGRGSDATTRWLMEYETKLPHTTQAPASPEERLLVTAYLDAPANVSTIEALALAHLAAIGAPGAPPRSGASLEHAVLALYFVDRLADLGRRDAWILQASRDVGGALRRALPIPQNISLDEDHPAHVYYRASFHQGQEQNRYAALTGLLDDIVRDPGDVYTSFAIAANNLWVGGEADFADPTVLYNFVLGSYFSVRTISMAKQLETDWMADPAQATRFRLATILGGFSVLQRRWLAVLHGDTKAVDAIDEEHRQWLPIQPAFHGFTYGLTYFEDPQRFQDGFAALVASFAFCQDTPGVRTCSDLPRFYFNLLSFELGFVDFQLRNGDVAGAKQTLQFRFQTAIPTNYGITDEVARFQDWSIGQEPWLHREKYADQIAAVYQAHPADGPANFEMKKRKWGTSTITCQECHETQGAQQTQAAFDEIQLPPPAVASVGTWPAVSTTWYGASR